MKPIDLSAIAIMPAKTPGPRIDTNNKAQIKELIEREETMINRAIGRNKVLLGVVFRAAKKATGTAMAVPNSVPKVAILSVSHNGDQSSLMDVQFGGNIRAPMSCI